MAKGLDFFMEFLKVKPVLAFVHPPAELVDQWTEGDRAVDTAAGDYDVGAVTDQHLAQPAAQRRELVELR